jgi:hypothetical protein
VFLSDFGFDICAVSSTPLSCSVQGSMNCFIAASLYVATMIFSIWQFLANRRIDLQV